MNAGEIKNIESEAGVIASVILKPELTFYSEQLKPNHFSDTQNGYIYWAVCELARRNVEVIDAYNIINMLNAYGTTRKQTESITIQAVADLIDVAKLIARSSVEDYKILVDNVLDAALRRHTYDKLVECEKLCFSSSEKDIEQKIYTALDNVMMEFSTMNDVPRYKEVVDGYWEQIQARQRGETESIEFPFPKLNEYVVLEPGEVVCFSGSAKSGKSAMLLTCTVDLLRKGKSVLYVDSEISSKLFTLRILSHITKIKFADLRSGTYSPEDEIKITEAIEWLKTRNFIHVYLPVFDANAIYLAAKKAKHMIDIDCIVVDYLKDTSDKSESFSVYAEMGQLSDCLKNRVCGEIGICGLTAAQATSSGKIADSARIARSVSTVVSITDKSIEDIEADGMDCGTKKLRVVFNRNGAQMMENEWIDMSFLGSTITYEQAPRQHSLVEPF